MQDRFIMSQTSFTVKVITKNGIETIREAKKPQGVWLDVLAHLFILFHMKKNWILIYNV